MQTSLSRFPLIVVMVLIGVVALGLGAMRAATPLAAGITFNAVVLTLLVGTLGALVRRGEPGWVGFSLFGWSYLLLAIVPVIEANTPALLSTSLVNFVVARIHSDPGPAPPRPILSTRLSSLVSDLSMLDYPENFAVNSGMRTALTPAEAAALDSYHDQLKTYQNRAAMFNNYCSWSYKAGQLCFVLIFALAGAFLGRALASPRRSAASEGVDSRGESVGVATLNNSAG